MIQIEPCKGCGRPLFTLPVANLDVRCETEALDAQEAVAALVAGRELWRATATGLSPASPAVLSALRTAEPGERPHVVVTHRCTAKAQEAAVRPQKPPAIPEVLACPKGRENGAQGVARADSVVPATPRRSRPTCEACRKEIVEGTPMMAIQLGDLYVWAEHVSECYN